MAIVDRTRARIVATSVALALAISACETTPRPSASSGPPSEPTPQPTSAPRPQTGGTLHVLTQSEQWNHVDPQRISTQEDLAFFGATLYRSLVAYTASPDPIEGTTLVPDLATDLGRASDGGRSWTFTLRDGVSFQTGDPITCEDIRYGVSRTFANNVISEGPRYAIQYLDVPTATALDADKGFLSSYHGPYASTPGQQAVFDKAVECSPDHRTITFHLNRPLGFFNAVTTLGFFPVPRTADTGETYGTTPGEFPVSSGPYMVERYIPNAEMVLVRNPSWSAASDPIRKAYPDRWVVEFAIDPAEIDRRLMASEGDDAFAIQYGQVQPRNLATVFDPTGAPREQFAGRAVSGFDPYSRHYWIDTTRVTSLQIRQALMVALDRASVRAAAAGESPFADGALTAGFGDGVLKPSIGRDYAPTGLWDSSFGRVIPPSGDPELARALIAASGETLPKLIFRAADTPTNQRVGRAVIDSLARAGIQVEFQPIEASHCYRPCQPDMTGDFGAAGWGHDFANASTVIPPLFTRTPSSDQSFDGSSYPDLSQVDDPSVDAAVDDALATLDRGQQAAKWQALNRRAVENAWVIPTFFGQSQTIAGTKVGPIYRWPAYASWPYAEMSVWE